MKKILLFLGLITFLGCEDMSSYGDFTGNNNYQLFPTINYSGSTKKDYICKLLISNRDTMADFNFTDFPGNTSTEKFILAHLVEEGVSGGCIVIPAKLDCLKESYYGSIKLSNIVFNYTTKTTAKTTTDTIIPESDFTYIYGSNSYGSSFSKLNTYSNSSLADGETGYFIISTPITSAIITHIKNSIDNPVVTPIPPDPYTSTIFHISATLSANDQTLFQPLVDAIPTSVVQQTGGLLFEISNNSENVLFNSQLFIGPSNGNMILLFKDDVDYLIPKYFGMLPTDTIDTLFQSNINPGLIKKQSSISLFYPIEDFSRDVDTALLLTNFKSVEIE